MLGETEENWRDCVEKTLALQPDSVTIYQMELPFNTTISGDLLKGTGQFTQPVADWSTKRRWVQRGVRGARGRRLPRGQRVHRRQESVDARASSTAIACGRAPTWRVSASRRLATSTACTCRTSTRGRRTAPRFARGDIPLSRAYRPTDEERMIREFVLQFKLGSVRPAYFREKYGVNILERFRDQLDSLAAEGYLEAATDDSRRAHARGPAARRRAADAILPARARRHSLHLIAAMPSSSSRWSEYRYRRRVQFHEMDAAGIVHFSWFFRYMEEAEHALWRAAGLSIAPPGSDIGFPRVAASFDYHRPLRFEDEFDVCDPRRRDEREDDALYVCR